MFVLSAVMNDLDPGSVPVVKISASKENKTYFLIVVDIVISLMGNE